MKHKLYCCKCKKETNLAKVTCRKEVQYYLCRECNTARAAKYRETARGRKNINKAVKKSIIKHKNKQLARKKLHSYLKRGCIKVPLLCEICNKLDRLYAHHTDYSQALKVIWCCIDCHSDLHRK
jgi:hypothetical protein